MSDDAETARQIAALTRDDRPLLVLDVDEVVLEFVRPFIAYVGHRGARFRSDSFRLHGNVVDAQTGDPLDHESVSALLSDFFAAQEDWQHAADGAAEAIGALGERAEIVMLTAMPHRFRAARRRLLDRLGIPFPLVTTEKAKGPAVALLAGERAAPVAFVDDIPHNLVSVANALERASLFHLMAHAELRKHLPPLQPGIRELSGWGEARAAIAQALEV